MLVVHANWFDGSLHLWGESLSSAREDVRVAAPAHPFGASAKDLRSALEPIIGSLNGAKEDHLDLLLPHASALAGDKSSRPTTLPSSRLAGLLGRVDNDEELRTLEPIRLQTLRIATNSTIKLLLEMRNIEGTQNDFFVCAHSMHWWMALTKFAFGKNRRIPRKRVQAECLPR